MASDRRPLLEVTNLRRVYQGHGGHTVTAVDDVSFALDHGGSLAIVGESGSGKTTIAKMLVGLERPDGGTILLDGQDVTIPSRRQAHRRARGQSIQIVFQDPYTSLDPTQPVGKGVLEVLRLHLRGNDSARRARAAELADLVGLDERQMRGLPRSLSGGQRQRVAIARALAASPRIIILDESVAALDVSIQAQVLNLLADIREETGVAYILISHDLAVVRQLTETAVVMRSGRLVEAGPTEQILDSPADAYTRRLRDSVPRPGWKPSRGRDLPPTDDTTTPTAQGA